MEEKIWRVKFKFGYNELVFDFENVEDASNFIMVATKTFNKDMVYEHKDLWCTIYYGDKEVKEDPDD